MGWMSRIAAAFVGFASFGAGLWVLGIICFLYFAISFRPRRTRKETEDTSGGFDIPRRVTVAGALLVLTALGILSGGTYSPMALFAAAVLVVLWPKLMPRQPFSEMTPVGNSILLRSKYSPFTWCALAELKPSAEDFPRAVSSFVGTMLVFITTGRVFALVRCLSLNRKAAETQALAKLRLSAITVGAYLLPLDGTAASDVLHLRLTRPTIPHADLTDSTPDVSGVLALDCGKGIVRRAAAFEMAEPTNSSVLPRSGGEVEGAPLIWEVLQAAGKRTNWPDPDAFSNLLDSMSATRGAPVAERIRAMEGSEGRVTVQSLSGEKVHLSRPQFRAILSIYS